MNDFLPTECDIVMEGGVTSGIVYPAFVARLARRFTLRSIGGASVGAVAAVAAAAAQYRRNRARAQGGADDDAGFTILARLPRRLQARVGGHTRLFSLFQPCADLAPHFGVLAASLNAPSRPRAVLRAATALLLRFPIGTGSGALAWMLGFVVSAGLLGGHWPRTAGGAIAAGLWFGLCLLAAALAGAALHAAFSAWRGLRANRCGICPGLRTDPGSPPALTEWLHALVQEIAGLDDAAPLTFGQLRTAQPPIELALMTTGLSELRAHRLPHSSADLVFRASELEALFPPPVMAALLAGARRSKHGKETSALLARLNADGEDWYFMPPADALPVVVAARMSLSFPVLLQAVPLYRLRVPPAGGHGLELLRTWFSDGGLTSNFPIHFFDAILPTRPTFGVTLQADLDAGAPFAHRVVLPTNNADGAVPAWLAIDAADGRPALARFAGAMLRTIRTWRDEALKRTPGYRDRIVLIRHTKQEGGLNLDMTRRAIATMSRSGSVAARRILDRFLDPEPQRNGWLNHRWVRMRSTAAVLQDMLAPLGEAWHDASLVPSYEALWQAQGADALPAYRLSKANRSVGFALWQRIVTLPEQLAPADLSDHAPQPQPELAIAPKLS
ncbi:patatin-like phospholipase family protein [uncultured Massilia sp.]|uniref:patatin-like phospholipase family protein n=1 Tax=uncultured Massilia sp. TaxID=169973 RepID=UPI0025D99597|nr:patatin-like phospholipase family protein [uncultured Massilia sp.]